MGLFSTSLISTGVSAFKSLTGAGKKDPNRGKQDIIDALDNYERISSSAAEGLIPGIRSRIASGNSNRQIAQWIAGRVGYGSREFINSYKYKILEDFLNRERSILRESRAQNTDKVTGTSPVNMGAAQTKGSPFSVSGISPVAIGLFGVVLFFIIRNFK